MSDDTAESAPPAPTRDAVVTLREITSANLRQVLRLKTTKAQENFVAPNEYSIAEAYFERDHAWFRAIYADETPVGFAMLYDDPHDPEGPNYYLWRFMIDERYQRMGFGRQALDRIVEHVRTRPNATNMTLSYVDEEGGPGDFYHGYGFVDTGEIDHGELVSRLVFSEDGYAPAQVEITLRPLTFENVRQALALAVEPEQGRFVAPVSASIAEAYLSEQPLLTQVIYAGETPVGFAMLKDSDEQPDGYFLWRFLIDRHYQRRGYGRRALALLAELVRTRPNGSSLGTAYLRGEGGPEGFYRKCGFVETGRAQAEQFEARLAL
jgi:diamine N-acetyltransferase